MLSGAHLNKIIFYLRPLAIEIKVGHSFFKELVYFHVINWKLTFENFFYIPYFVHS